MPDQSIYEMIVAHSKLLPKHEKELIEKRGFDRETIKTLKFRSGGEYLQKIGYLWENVPYEFRPSLLEDRILIPYMHKKGDVFHLRPHQRGLKGSGSKIYVPFLMQERSSYQRLVVTEGEFKAVASCLMGVPAISVPGISSFSRKKLPELINLLDQYDCREVIICFDNEVKDDPAFPNFKPKYTARYDTLIYEYIMAAALTSYITESGKRLNAKIARLPDEWRENGKIDIDGALAQKRSHQEYKTIIQNAYTPEEYKHEWKIPNLHRAYIERRIERYFYKGPIEIQFQSYYINESQRDEPEKKARKPKIKKISNFTIDIAYTAFGRQSAERACKLKSLYGESRPFIVNPDMMVSKTAFQKICYRLGDYQFMGTENDLQYMWHHAFLEQDGRDVKKLKAFGYDDESRMWFFANGGYDKDVFYPAEDRLVWVGDQGFMLPQGMDNKDEDMTPPTLSTSESVLDIQLIHSHLRSVQDPNYSKLILGWALGNFFMPEILAEWKVYPFLFLYGKLASGKSTLANWVSSFFGFALKGIPFTGSTVVGMSRAVANYSMIPVWLEEFRNNDVKNINKTSMLRSIYDKSTVVKGTIVEDEIKTYKPRSTLIISGEEPPRDAALNSRCVLIPMYNNDQASNKESLDWLQTNASNFNAVGHHILTNKSVYWPQIKERISKSVKDFENDKKYADNRSKYHLSILLGVCDVFLGKSESFVNFISQEALNRTRVVGDAQAIFVFLEDVLNLFNTNQIDFDCVKMVYKFKSDRGINYDNACAFAFTSIYSTWEKHFLKIRNDMPVAQSAMLDHFKHESYYIGSRNVKIKGKSIRCLLFDAENPKFPEQFKAMLLGSNPNFKEAYNVYEQDIMSDDTQFNNHVLSKKKDLFNENSENKEDKKLEFGDKENLPI